MAQLRSDPTTKADFIEYLETESDFAFELAVLHALNESSIRCEHGGTYQDSVTGKTRQFDIRACVDAGNTHLHLAIECKNLRANFPVLGSCVPRREEEAFHEVMYTPRAQQDHTSFALTSLSPRSWALPVRGPHSLYRSGEPVCKSTSQVGRARNSGQIESNDNEVFDKWAQCLSSAEGMASLLEHSGDASEPHVSCLIPIVVVPNDRLWSVQFDATGLRLGDPAPTERLPCFLNRSYVVQRMPNAWYSVSHIELMTFRGLMGFLRDIQAKVVDLFPQQGIHVALQAASR